MKKEQESVSVRLAQNILETLHCYLLNKQVFFFLLHAFLLRSALNMYFQWRLTCVIFCILMLFASLPTDLSLHNMQTVVYIQIIMQSYRISTTCTLVDELQHRGVTTNFTRSARSCSYKHIATNDNNIHIRARAQLQCMLTAILCFAFCQVFDGSEPIQDPLNSCLYYLCNGGQLDTIDVSHSCQVCADVSHIYQHYTYIRLQALMLNVTHINEVILFVRI